MSATVIVAPTDAQLDLIGRLCRERRLEVPAVHSGTEASAAIDALIDGTFDPWDFAPVGPCPFCDTGPCRNCQAGGPFDVRV